MPKILLLLLLFLIASPVSAASDVRVNISDNLEGSTNKVQIDSNTGGVKQSSSNNYSNSTSIKINQNGEVKEYNGSDGNINIQSSDGKTSVSVKNNSVENENTSSDTNIKTKTNITVNANTNNSPTPSASASESAEATVAGIFNDNTFKTKVNSGFWENLIRRINAIFDSIF